MFDKKRSFRRARLALACVAAVLAVVLCAVVSPVRAMADEVMAYSLDESGNRTNYYTTDAAITAGYSGKTIYLAVDWMFTGTMTVADSQSLTINMNGHRITSQGNGPVIRMYEKSTLELTCDESYNITYDAFVDVNGTEVTRKISTGGLITGGHEATSSTTFSSHNETGGIRMDAKSHLILSNVTVGGNSGYASGGIATKDGCRIDMKNNARVEFNFGDIGGGIITAGDEDTIINMDHSCVMNNHSNLQGGGICAYGDSIQLNMKNESHVSSNDAKGMGGGIYINYSWFNIESDSTCSVGYNRTTDRKYDNYGGGGIYVCSRNFGTNQGIIKGLTIIGNNSFCYGGGIYLDQNWTKVIDCRIVSNRAARAGGGVYDDGDDNYLSGCVVTNNTCNYSDRTEEAFEGGGVFVTYRYTLHLAEVCTIKDNSRKDGTVDDLFLNNNVGFSDHALLSSDLKEGSSVGVRTGITGSARIAKNTPNYITGTIFMDMDGYYVTHGSDRGGDLWQRKGSDGFLAKVNGKGSTRYAWKSTVTADGESTDKTKHFWYWDIDNSTGLSSVDTDALKAKKYNERVSYSMPQNDTDLKAVYADYVTAASFTLTKPVVGQWLSLGGTFAYKRGGSTEYDGSTQKVSVEWYEVAADGTRTPTLGYAKHNTTYEAVVTVGENCEEGAFYSADCLAGKDVTVRTADGTVTATATSTSVNATDGSLSFTTCAFTTDKAEVKSVQPESLAITSGYTKDDIADMLPDYANAELSDGKAALLATDKGNIEWDTAMFDADGKTVEPDTDTADFTAKLHLKESDQAVDAQEAYVEVTITVAKGGVLSAPNVEPVSGTYNTVDSSPALDENLRLKVTASSANKDENAKIMYRVAGDSAEYAYDANTGVVLTGKANDKVSYELAFWVQSENATGTVYSPETTVSYTLDDTANKAITVNCSDTAYYAEGSEHWSSTFTVTGTLNSSVYVVAPAQDGRVFDHWEWAEAPSGTDLESKTLTISNYSLDYTNQITAVYTPVISKIDLGITAPAAHASLDAAASYVKFGFGGGEATSDATDLFKSDGAATITWSPAAQDDGTAAHLSSYTATLTASDDERFEDCNYALADSVVICLNGADLSGAAYMDADDSGNTTLNVDFPSTGAYEYQSLCALDDVELTFEQASACQAAGEDADWGLPKAVLCNFKCGESALLDVDWDEVTGFDASATTAQELTVTGTVGYTADVDNEGAPATVTVKIKVAAPEKAAAPKASVESGTYDAPQSVYLGCETEGATIYYTIDGTEPVVPADGAETTTVEYTGDAIVVGDDTVLKAIAVREGMLASDTATFEYTITRDAAAAPAASLAPGVYADPQTVELTCATDGATIYYTTDGTQPDESSARYDGTPIQVGATTTIKAFAGKDGMADSATVSFSYVIERARMAKPQATPAPGTYSEAQKVTISSATEGAVIRYTTDGSDPGETSPVYDGSEIAVDNSMTIKAIAYSGDGSADPSDAAEFVYKIQSEPVVTHAVTFDSAGGSSVEGQVVADGECAKRPADPVRDGYVFGGWLTESGAEYDFDAPVTADLALHASWTEDVVPVTYHTVSFDSKGGSAVESQAVADGEKATKPADPVRDGYAFKGWYTKAGEKYDFSAAVTSDLKLVAKWEKGSEPVGRVQMLRLYNPYTGEHLYTSSEVEKAARVADGWRDEARPGLPRRSPRRRSTASTTPTPPAATTTTPPAGPRSRA